MTLLLSNMKNEKVKVENENKSLIKSLEETSNRTTQEEEKPFLTELYQEMDLLKSQIQESKNRLRQKDLIIKDLQSDKRTSAGLMQNDDKDSKIISLGKDLKQAEAKTRKLKLQYESQQDELQKNFKKVSLV